MNVSESQGNPGGRTHRYRALREVPDRGELDQRAQETRQNLETIKRDPAAGAPRKKLSDRLEQYAKDGDKLGREPRGLKRVVSVMAKTSPTWTVPLHGPIERLSDRVWRVEAELSGTLMKRVMTVVRRTDGTLVIHNAIALDADAMAAIDGWGRVSTIVVPNAFHRVDARVFHERYPDACVVCPSGAGGKVAEVVEVWGCYEDVTADGVVDLVTLEGLKAREGVMIVREPDGVTLVFNDAVFNMPDVPGVKGFVLKHVTSSSGPPRVSRLCRLFMVADKSRFRGHLEQLAGTRGCAGSSSRITRRSIAMRLVSCERSPPRCDEHRLRGERVVRR